MKSKMKSIWSAICEKSGEIFFKINCKVGHFIDPRDEVASTIIAIFVSFLIALMVSAAK